MKINDFFTTKSQRAQKKEIFNWALNFVYLRDLCVFVVNSDTTTNHLSETDKDQLPY